MSIKDIAMSGKLDRFKQSKTSQRVANIHIQNAPRGDIGVDFYYYGGPFPISHVEILLRDIR